MLLFLFQQLYKKDEKDSIPAAEEETIMEVQDAVIMTEEETMQIAPQDFRDFLIGNGVSAEEAQKIINEFKITQ